MTHISAAVYIWPVNVTALIDDFLPVCVERDRSSLFFFLSFFGGGGAETHIPRSCTPLHKIINPTCNVRLTLWMYVCFHSRFYSFGGRKVISGVFIKVPPGN